MATTTHATATPVRYIGTVPKTLRDYIEKHCAGKVYEVDHGGGYTTESGSAYDVGIVAGWCLSAAYDWMHTIIEPTVRDVIDRLKTLQPCHDDDECRAAWASGKAAGSVKNQSAVALGKLGGRARSDAKTKAARLNAKRGGRPKGYSPKKKRTTAD